MKKILIIINNLGVGGAERLVVDDINEMISCGSNVRLLTLKTEPAFSLKQDCILPEKYWQTIPFGNLFNISKWIKVCAYIKREKPDIVLTHLWFSNTIGRIACRLIGLRNVISFEHNVYGKLKTKKMYAIDIMLQNWCKKIIAVSGAVKDSLIAHGIRENNIIVINNGIDVSKYNKKSNPGLRKKLGIGDDIFVFLTIGRLIRQKGIDVLLKAFAKLPDNSILLIVGQGADGEALKQLAENLGVKKRTQFLGVRHDVPEILSICDSFVLASRYEGLGIVILEAMAAAKPIVISDFDAGRDMITSGVHGLVVKKESIDDLAEAMNDLMFKKDLRDRLATSAYKKVQDFSIQEHVNKILSL